MKKSYLLLIFCLSLLSLSAQEDFLLEAESFPLTGGWLIDAQFVEQVGSPYLIAHGAGKAVADAEAEIKLPNKGTYHVWVRTKNWVPGNWEAPGRFKVAIDNTPLESTLGLTPGWGWEYAGAFENKAKVLSVKLQDLTGFNGRCDALYFSQDRSTAPPNETEALAAWRTEKLGTPEAPEEVKDYDLIVTGGGIAGCAA
ncbi:MAG: hypothetical protein AAGA62_19240, partial [Bacteroidota bacterium]